MNRDAFFREVRLSFGKLTASQVDGFSRILDEWERRKLTDPRWLANMLAQTYHETAAKMQPISEMGGEQYLRSKPYYPFVGEGLIQVTWQKNYAKFGAYQRGQLLTWPIALRALFDGMIKGMFTGRKLADYFDHNTNDPLHARRIINGMDKAELIRRHHVHFLHAVELASKPAAKAA